MNTDTVKAVALVGAIAGVGYLAWRTYQQGNNAVAAVRQSIDETTSSVSSWWNNNVAHPFSGVVAPKSTKEALYSDAGYAGLDAATGVPVLQGEWYSDAEARRYDYQQRAAGATPAATSINGAAFGIYPRALSAPQMQTPTQAMVRAVDVNVPWY
ncbi:MAG: hypothetical protein J0H69_00650 [Burkholderiales bacterium]|nr:hypothetical protein [Burkholderiales bacterium]